MAGIRWTIRKTESYQLDDGLWLGEPIFHLVENRLAIMDDVFVGWWPLIDPTTNTMILGQGDALSGKNNGDPHMQINWHTSDEMHISHLHPNHPWFPHDPDPLHDDNETPVPMLRITSTEQTVRVAGPDERLNNGGANSLESFAVPFEQYEGVEVNKQSITNELKQLGGNGFVWVKNPDDNMGVIVENIGTVDNSLAIKNKGDAKQTWHGVGKNAISFRVPADKAVSNNVGRGLGYRSWVHLPFANQKKLTFSMVVNSYSLQDMSFSTRIGYPDNWQLFTSKLVAPGQHHLVFHFDPAKVKEINLNKPLCIDWFYDWFYAFETFPFHTEVKMALASLTVHEGWWEADQLNPSFLSPQEERNNAFCYGFSELKHYAYSPIGEVIFSKPLVSNEYRLALTSTKSITILEKKRSGFVFASDAEEGEEWSFNYYAKVVGDVADIV